MNEKTELRRQTRDVVVVVVVVAVVFISETLKITDKICYVNE